MLKRLVLLLLTLFLGAGLYAAKKNYPMHSKSHPIPIIIDTDVDITDLMTITYLVKSHDVQIRAITTLGDRMAHYEYTVPNVLNLLQLLDKPTIPVAYGAKMSMSPVGRYPHRWRLAVDNVMGIKLPHNKHKASKLTSSELMVDLITKSPTKMTILCLGPLTNLAQALLDTPSISQNVKQVVIMGGAINTPGNIVNEIDGHKNTMAEYNIALDAKAASIVFESGIPITLVPLNATNHVPISKEFYEELKHQEKTKAAGFVAELIEHFVYNPDGQKMYFWGTLAATLITNPKIGYYKNLKIEIDLDSGPDYGKTEVTNQGVPVTVTTNANSKLFYNTFLNTINSDKR